MHQPDRLRLRTTAWAGDPSDGDCKIGQRMRERALRHFDGRLVAHRAVAHERHRLHAQHFLLGFIRVGDEAALDHIRGAGDLRQSGGDKAAGTGLRCRHLEAPRTAPFEQARRQAA
jgi:hypothetical protein